MITIKRITVWGETLTVAYTGGSWVSRCNGQQHARAADALRAEARELALAGGDQPDEPKIAAEIEAAIAQAVK